MGCTRLDLGSGHVAIICSRGRKPRATCAFCGAKGAGLLCDFQIGAKKTCDRAMCSRCAKHVGPDRDLSPPHANAETAQLSLFGGK